MKRLTIFLFIAVLLAGSIYGQSRDTRQGENNSVTVDGILKLERGFVAVESGDTVYYVPMLNRYIGFIDALKEGTAVSVEGNGFRNIIQPTKITIGDQSYDFPALDRIFALRNQNFSPRQNQPQMREPFNRQWANPRQQFNTPNPDRRIAPDRRNAPGRNTCSCNCGRTGRR